jgi:hypothetical protein
VDHVFEKLVTVNLAYHGRYLDQLIKWIMSHSSYILLNSKMSILLEEKIGRIARFCMVRLELLPVDLDPLTGFPDSLCALPSLYIEMAYRGRSQMQCCLRGYCMT